MRLRSIDPTRSSWASEESTLRKELRRLSRLVYNGIAYVQGEFKSKEDAALAHDTAQRELHGERAIVNYITKAKSDR